MDEQLECNRMWDIRTDEMQVEQEECHRISEASFQRLMDSVVASLSDLQELKADMAALRASRPVLTALLEELKEGLAETMKMSKSNGLRLRALEYQVYGR